ncbi:regulator of chromosome condensation 1/beta-lactamase-inhibitor protein II [Diplogelasinospora grovesii]|uniref:Regulator of chromosome condensation 1/beta-lactamase-inhibitor protein II n=1 Tax=Diplogelasinospora grovesii TaxID=303347 RepID=A0AAN6N3I9_9PEZI|nr:regulator of chromosome condensation 1/beta-lactamase-inhibitor protein II [Diplogelasinospora grovesii]
MPSIARAPQLIPSRSRSAKRKQAVEDDGHARELKKTKIVSSTRNSGSRPSGKKRRTALLSSSRYEAAEPSSINQAPTQVLAVLVFGNGDAGELGLGPAEQEAPRPCLNPFLNPDSPSALHHIVQLDCGGMHTIALTKDNKIVTWGVNDNGALGRDTDWEGGGLRDIEGDRDLEQVGASDPPPEQDGTLNPLESTPTPLPTDYFPSGTRFVQVAAGDSCSLALTDTGLVYGWGTFKSSEGEEMFGYDAVEQIIKIQARPTLIRGLKKITQIACGANHALALDANGVVWAWGCGEQNQLGRRLFGRRFMECLNPHPIEIKNVKYIASGEYHSFAVDKKDNVWAWGLNSFGEAGYAKAAGSDLVLLPYPMKIPGLRRRGVVCLDGGAHHSAAVTADGQCLVWGRLDGGQLGIRFSPEQLQDDSLIRYDERNNPRICLRPTPGSDDIGEVSWVACGTDHTIFITKEGTAYATGFNSQGQLGLGDEDDDVEVARRIKGKVMKDRVLTWAGAGGQFSMVAAPSTKPADGN